MPKAPILNPLSAIMGGDVAKMVNAERSPHLGEAQRVDGDDTLICRFKSCHLFPKKEEYEAVFQKDTR